MEGEWEMSIRVLSEPVKKMVSGARPARGRPRAECRFPGLSCPWSYACLKRFRRTLFCRCKKTKLKTRKDLQMSEGH